jgi:alpha-L-fucosidase 2
MQTKKACKFILILAVLVTVAFAGFGQQKQSNPNERLWYASPAKYWNSQGLHLGNGSLGVTFMGGVSSETFMLAESSFWTGRPAGDNWEQAGVNPAALKALPSIRKAIADANYALSDSLVRASFLGRSTVFGTFTSVGRLLVEDQTKGQANRYDRYVRALDLKDATGSVSYWVNNVRYRREYFCSYPDQVFAARYLASRPKAIHKRLKLELYHPIDSAYFNDNEWIVTGHIADNNRPFCIGIKVNTKAGRTDYQDSCLVVTGADALEVYLTIKTNYKLEYPLYQGDSPVPVTKRILSGITPGGYLALKKRHIADYQSLYSKTSLILSGNPAVDWLATDERFKLARTHKITPGYAEMAYNLGKYLLISSSRPGGLPANLQGVWNDFENSPWSGNFQSNINLQMIYWSFGSAGLYDCHLPYIKWIEDLTKPGSQIARRCYGTAGWVSHATGNVWGHAAPEGGMEYGLYPVGAAWHCLHVWEHFRFTADTAYLKRHYPILKGASRFWLENLQPFENKLISNPSVSAEHGAYLKNNELTATTGGRKDVKSFYSLRSPYQDIQMVKNLFINASQAALLCNDVPFADSLKKQLAGLMPQKVGRYGQLQEWADDLDNPENHHRHIAHLYALYPGEEIDPIATPELAQAAKVALDMRGDRRFYREELVSGGNWSRAHRMWCRIRLQQGDVAYRILGQILTEQGFENLLTFQHINYDWNRPGHYREADSLSCHFQLDASASIPGALAEMIVQSHNERINLLAALPRAMPNGKARGIRLRGGYSIDIEWNENQLKKATVYIHSKKIPTLLLKNKPVNLKTDLRFSIVETAGVGTR